MKDLLERVVEQLGRSLEAYPWEDSQAYANWLAQTYYYVAHSTRLLAAAAARMPFTPLGNQLHHRCAKHMGEEKKHELLAAHDLQVLGYQLQSFPELPATRLFYEPQYTKIERSDPISLFGYILVLEAMSAAHGTMHVNRVAAAHGPRATSFLKLHASEDQSHVEKALESLAQLKDETSRLVEANIQQSAFAYELLLRVASEAATARTNLSSGFFQHAGAAG